MDWVKKTFTVLRGKLMKGLPWGIYFNKYGKVDRDGAALENRIAQLLRDDEDVGDITYIVQVKNTRRNTVCTTRDTIFIRQRKQPYPSFLSEPL